MSKAVSETIGAEMTQQVDEAWMGEDCISFDGRVVEVFGLSQAERLHVREFGYEVDGPDRKGRYVLRIGRRRKGKMKGGAMMAVDGEDWPAVEAVLQRIDATQAELGVGRDFG